MTPKTLLFDIDGVLAISWQPIDGAARVIREARKAGHRLGFLTNTTSRPRAAIATQLDAIGIEVNETEVLTAATAAAEYLSAHRPKARCLLLNSGYLGEDFSEIELVGADEVPDVVVTGGAGPEISYELVNRAFRALMAGADLVVMHRNWYWATVDGMQLDMGAFVVGLERAARVDGVLVGKPAPAFFEAALRMVGGEASSSMMVGDDVESDVLGAQALGIEGVLVRTGKFSEDSLRAASGVPDHLVASVADLPALLG